MFYLGATQLLFDSWFATGKESKDTVTNCWADCLPNEAVVTSLLLK